MKRILLGLVLAASVVAFGEEALLWEFTDPMMTGWWFERMKAKDAKDLQGNHLNINAARVKAISGGTETYLELYAGQDTTFEPLGTALAMSENWIIDPLYAGLGTSSEGFQDVQYMIELGNYTGEGENGWVAMACSSLADYNTLKSGGQIMEMQSYASPASSAWNGGAYAIPEPTSGLLTLLGCALMAIRRKRMV